MKQLYLLQQKSYMTLLWNIWIKWEILKLNKWKHWGNQLNLFSLTYSPKSLENSNFLAIVIEPLYKNLRLLVFCCEWHYKKKYQVIGNCGLKLVTYSAWQRQNQKEKIILEMFFRIEAQNENDSSRWFLYQSIFLIVTVMTCVAPLIVFLTVKSTILGEVCFFIVIILI